MQELSLIFAEMAKKLHSTKADTTKLVSTKEKFRRFYLEKAVVPDFYKQKALAFIDTVPDTPTCLHGDLQISNVITDGKRTLCGVLGKRVRRRPHQGGKQLSLQPENGVAEC